MDKQLILLLLAIIVVECTAQWCLQKNLLKKNNVYLIIGIVLYGVVGIIYYNMIKHGKKLAIANTLWNAGSEISVAILGFLFFNQTLNLEQIIGIIIILFAMYLV